MTDPPRLIGESLPASLHRQTEELIAKHRATLDELAAVLITGLDFGKQPMIVAQMKPNGTVTMIDPADFYLDPREERWPGRVILEKYVSPWSDPLELPVPVEKSSAPKVRHHPVPTTPRRYRPR